MKNSFKRGKLQLAFEAVRNLTNIQLDAVAGGVSFANTCNVFTGCYGTCNVTGHNSCADKGCLD